ncbi:hypothetical protein N9878_01630 [bacterium]|nr:hypothetical protein [bacterium]
MANPYIPKLGPSAATALPGLPRRKSTVATVSNAYNWQPNMESSGISFDTSPQSATNAGHFMSQDGFHMYAVEESGANDNIIHYDLSIAWDISTAVLQAELAIGGQDSSPRNGFISKDGSKIYIVGGVNDTIYQYTLSTPYSLTGASYSGKSFSVLPQTGSALGIWVSEDGTRWYTSDGAFVDQYSMSTPFDISTSAFTNGPLNMGSGTFDIFFSPDESKMYVVNNTDQAIEQWTLATPRDIDTASEDNVSFSFGGTQTSGAAGVSMSPNQSFMTIGDNTNNFIYRYNLVEI